MNFRKRLLICVCLSIFFFLFIVCTRHPIILENVYAKPDVDFNTYRRLAIVEFAPDTIVKKERTITHIFEDEFQKQGFDIIGADEVHSVLKNSGFSREDLLNPEILNNVSEKLHVKAFVRGEVKEYKVKKKDEYVPIAFPGGIIDVGGKIYFCDISLRVEMKDSREGKTIWTCSMSCNKKKGKPERLIRNMIRDSLRTIGE
jgi:hypothetical protein